MLEFIRRFLWRRHLKKRHRRIRIDLEYITLDADIPDDIKAELILSGLKLLRAIELEL